MEELSKNRLFLVLGDRAFAEDNLPEAYTYYKKAVEEAYDDPESMLKKGYAALVLSEKNRFRLKEMLFAIQRSEKDAELAQIYMEKMLGFAENFMRERIGEFYAQQATGFMCKKELYLLENADKAALLTLEAARYAMEKYKDDAEKLMAARKLACEAIHFICIDYYYFTDTNLLEKCFGGRAYPDKKAYIAEYDELCYQIRADEPKYRKEDENPINRIMPQKEEEKYELQRARVLSVFQRHKDREFEMRRREEKYQQEMEQKKLFWKDHPEEYQKYLDELAEMRDKHQRLLKKLKEYDEIIDMVYDQRQIMILNAGPIWGKKARARKEAEIKIAELNYRLMNEFSDWSEYR